jgi:hypothetical protein
MMVLPKLLLLALAVLPLAVSCQTGGDARSTAAGLHAPVTRKQAEKKIADLTFPLTRAEFAKHFPAVSLATDPPVFSFPFTPNDLSTAG